MHQKLVSFIAFIEKRSTVINFTTEEKDLVIIGGGVAGYVAAIKAGQSGLKVRLTPPLLE